MKRQHVGRRATEDRAIKRLLCSLYPEGLKDLPELIASAQRQSLAEALTVQHQRPSDLLLFSPSKDPFDLRVEWAGEKPIWVVEKGFWRLQLAAFNKFNQFTITVKVGDQYRLMPDEIKQTFRQWFPDHEWQDRYRHWKQLVLDDLDSARDLIQLVEPRNDLASMTCCESSERLCRKLGLRVEQGFAFLFRKGSIAAPAANGIRQLCRES